MTKQQEQVPSPQEQAKLIQEYEKKLKSALDMVVKYEKEIADRDAEIKNLREKVQELESQFSAFGQATQQLQTQLDRADILLDPERVKIVVSRRQLLNP